MTIGVTKSVRTHQTSVDVAVDQITATTIAKNGEVKALIVSNEVQSVIIGWHSASQKFPVFSINHAIRVNILKHNISWRGLGRLIGMFSFIKGCISRCYGIDVISVLKNSFIDITVVFTNRSSHHGSCIANLNIPERSKIKHFIFNRVKVWRDIN